MENIFTVERHSLLLQYLLREGFISEAYLKQLHNRYHLANSVPMSEFVMNFSLLELKEKKKVNKGSGEIKNQKRSMKKEYDQA